MANDRGVVVALTMDIEYPDGSTKRVTYDAAWLADTAALLLHESVMDEEQTQAFAAKEDWEKNPAMIRVTVVGESHTICMRPGHSGDDQ